MEYFLEIPLKVENALLYTFSTIAQSLAGVGALLVAFALYRMQSFDATSQKAAFLLRQRHLGDEELARVAAEERYEAFLTRYRALEPNINVANIGADNLAQFHRLVTSSTTTRRLQSALKRALVVTGVVMSGSVALLTFTPWLKDEKVLAVVLLASGVLGFVFCLIQYFNLVKEVITGADLA